MCGITGTIFTKELNFASRVDPYVTLIRLVASQDKLSPLEIDELFHFSVMYKSDINFLNYFESEHEQKTIKNIVKILREKYQLHFKNNITNTSQHKSDSWEDDCDKILDTIWFLDDELTFRCNFVKSFLDEDKKIPLPRHSLQFFKTLNSIINSINLLEMRGRDSLGLCFQFVIKLNEDNLEWYKKTEINQQFMAAIVDDKIVIHAIYRTFSRIGVLGENSEVILSQLRADNTIMELIKSGIYDSISIVGHTRWASVGLVNQQNIHPLINLIKPTDQIPTILSFVNGDIYNYKEIYKNMVWKNKVEYNLNEENDSIGLSYLFSEKGALSTLGNIQEKLMNIVGSLTGIILSDENPGKVLLLKKGNQGMFLGKNNDRIYFSSDAYGLVDDCGQDYNLDDGFFGLLDSGSNKSEIKIHRINSPIEKTIKDENFAKLTITSRDVSRKSYKHYLLKEIYETKDILESTLRRYITT
jgi:glutamine---fructose-6-phosphate transaminase (isomerizing)